METAGQITRTHQENPDGGAALSTLLEGLLPAPAPKIPPIWVRGLAHDSRAVEPGYVFIALRGHRLDGHLYAQDAIRKGAVAVVGEHPPAEPETWAVPFFTVPDSHAALSRMAARFYGEPFRNMTLIGITGTNGKTTTSYLIESILSAAGAVPGVMGTINHRCPGREWKVPMTTPESLEIMKSLRVMADAGVTHVVMEVSSHALHQRRIADCSFQVAVFTNLSRDHLDYHASMEEYFTAKSQLFRDLTPLSGRNGRPVSAIINLDDPRGVELRALTQAQVLTYGQTAGCDFRAENVTFSATGLSATLMTPVGRVDIRSPLVGTFNLHNILAATAAGFALGLDLETVKAGISALKGVPGRLQPVPNTCGLTILVDYAHTPDALQKVLEGLRPLTRGRIIAVFGCGGDRDTGKRPEMGRVAAALSDVVVITSDNPRSESPATIIAQIEAGVAETGLRKLIEGVTCSGEPGQGTAHKGYLVETDRKAAIAHAVRMARPQDVVLIAGKGHEDYQIIGPCTVHFDDLEVAAEAARLEA